MPGSSNRASLLSQVCRNYSYFQDQESGSSLGLGCGCKQTFLLSSETPMRHMSPILSSGQTFPIHHDTEGLII